MKTGQVIAAMLCLLGASCSLGQKDACFSNAGCFGGLTCVNGHCQQEDGGPRPDAHDAHDAPAAPADGAHDRRDGSTDHEDGPPNRSGPQDGSSDGQDSSSDHRDSSTDSGDGSPAAVDGAPAPASEGSCGGRTVNACSGPAASGQCQQVYCGGRLWRDGPHALTAYIPYRIRDPQGLFSDTYKAAIRASAAAWSNATAGLVLFDECSTCTGRFISVVPGAGDGISHSEQWEELLPLPVDSTSPATIPWHRIAHQWGHAIGLDDMYRRPDRDRYTTFDPLVWCDDGASLPATCAFSDPAQQPGSPPIASGTFGAYDELSVMNGLPSEGVCGNIVADPSSGTPTLGDVSAVEELYFGSDGPWAPFQPVGRSGNPSQPLDDQLAPYVYPIGGPALAEWTAPSVDIVVRGSDGNVYETWNNLEGTMFLDWADWRVVADHVDADPAVVFAGPNTLHLVVRSGVDGTIRLRTRTAGVWSTWGSLGAPPVGAASAPAIAALDLWSLTVVVRGGDNLLYRFECTDPATMCAASAAAPNAWVPLPAPTSGGFIGKPSLIWLADATGMIVSGIGLDNLAWANGGGPDHWGTWEQIVGVSVARNDPDPAVSMASNGGWFGCNFFARDPSGLLFQSVKGGMPLELGGVLMSAPSAVGTALGDLRVDIVALINDHGHPGVWWKFLSPQNTPPCNYNAPGTCAQCGCGFSGGPRCDL